nr:MAG TPA: hypothetical protein [Caudoviricetes sp.]
MAVLTKYSSINSHPFNKIRQNCWIRQTKKWKKLLWRTNSSLCYNCTIEKTIKTGGNNMIIIDGMPASEPNENKTPKPWEG